MSGVLGIPCRTDINPIGELFAGFRKKAEKTKAYSN
jgi:hypothetical protein